MTKLSNTSSDYAEIISLEDFTKLRDQFSRIVCTSGGYDPIHPGHTSCIIDSQHFGDCLVVVVNGNDFLQRKKGKAFMDLMSRCQLIASIRGVDYVIPFEINDDATVCEALRQIQPHVFTKGGDRTDISNIPEWSLCEALGIEIINNVGLAKSWHSSELLASWKQD